MKRAAHLLLAMIFMVGIFVPNVQAAEQKTMTINVKVPDTNFWNEKFVFQDGPSILRDLAVVAKIPESKDPKQQRFVLLNRGENSGTFTITTDENINIQLKTIFYPYTRGVNTSQAMLVKNTGQTITVNIGYIANPTTTVH